ncbi:MAG TPA: aldolase/citrate lyase family protein [Verrucomicrobiae bacterium]|nr:aldolase/citrate lyase family protein [Verrucomicrobiae bacterium]
MDDPVLSYRTTRGFLNGMQPSFVLQRIARREMVITAKACYTDPELVELIASSGFDAVWICTEHKRMDPAMVYALIQACRLGGADALVRVRPSNYSEVLHLIESGARGIMLPRVTHPDEVREVVRAMKFPPLGCRGYDGIHAEADFGRLPAGEYLSKANSENFLVVQIEEPAVVPHIESIAAMPGVDVLFVGPGDLTLGLGKFGRTDEPDVRSIMQAVADACLRHGKVAAIPCAPEQVKGYHAMGYRFFNIMSDYRCVFNGMRAARAAVGIDSREKNTAP